MRHLLGALLTGLACVGVARAQAPAAAGPQLKTVKDKASYAIGLQIGGSIKAQAFELDADLLAQGIRDALADKPALTPAEISKVMGEFQQQAEAAQAERGRVEGEKNKQEAATFLAANKAKEGVKTLASGMQYKIIKQGAGKRPTAKDTVTTHYTGTLLNGKVFDSSVQRNEPATFPVNGVIAGWTEALQLMNVGSKWQLFIPAELAYGPEGRPPVIPPNSLLIFEVELLDIAAP